jgi:hypothetical protein
VADTPCLRKTSRKPIESRQILDEQIVGLKSKKKP